MNATVTITPDEAKEISTELRALRADYRALCPLQSPWGLRAGIHERSHIAEILHAVEHDCRVLRVIRFALRMEREQEQGAIARAARRRC